MMSIYLSRLFPRSKLVDSPDDPYSPNEQIGDEAYSQIGDSPDDQDDQDSPER